ncbi:hypothetical protein RJ639_005273 [Escallonia herrerae]|uniref:Expansin-like EG45 domain-containing protein n=1 Tax=Escallonia herrerae TaxID=1293975 RepID=A0AA89AXS8_9ASTE|nr:hypothetical protein RJ639_005273 [Escallonia herrerae]
MEDLHVDMNRTNRLINHRSHQRAEICRIPPQNPEVSESASACDGFEEQGVMIAAASDEFWDNGGACGSWYRVKCIGATKQGDPDRCNGDNSVVVKMSTINEKNEVEFNVEGFVLVFKPGNS